MTTSNSLAASSAPRELPQAVFTDFSTLNALRSSAGSNSSVDAESGQLEEAARQFSSIFLHMALKSMRDASFGGGILDSQQSEFYRDMFDQQLALELSEGEGFGLTQLIVDQLTQRGQPDSPQAPTPGNGGRQGNSASVNAAQAYAAVERTTQSAQVPAESADTTLNDYRPADLEDTDIFSRIDSDKTMRLALP